MIVLNPPRNVWSMGWVRSKNKDVTSGASKKLSNDGFTVVKRKGGNTKKFNAIQMNKFEYRPVATKDTKTDVIDDSTMENVQPSSRLFKRCVYI